MSRRPPLTSEACFAILDSYFDGDVLNKADMTVVLKLARCYPPAHRVVVDRALVRTGKPVTPNEMDWIKLWVSHQAMFADPHSNAPAHYRKKSRTHNYQRGDVRYVCNCTQRAEIEIKRIIARDIIGVGTGFGLKSLAFVSEWA